MAKPEYYYHTSRPPLSKDSSLFSSPAMSFGWTLYVDEAVSLMPINLLLYFRIGNVIFGALAVWESDLQISIRFVKNGYLKKTANIWKCYQWFPCQITSEKWAQKFHTDDASLVLLIDCANDVGNLIRPTRSTTQIDRKRKDRLQIFCHVHVY